jgi:ubiquinone/menaquinone biosynthesis C-methylase UbiE
MDQQDDIQRLRLVYAERGIRLANSDIYSYFNRAYLFTFQQRQRALLRALAHRGMKSLAEQRILEVGCGSGGVLAEFQMLGAEPSALFGVDLLADRLCEAQQHLPGSGIACADGQSLPFGDRSFDIIVQYTAFSSILDPGIKARAAAEMLRTLRAEGLIVWYDFWTNPTNPQTRGIGPTEVRKLYPKCTYEFHRVTLAPPIARRIAPLSWTVALVLESMKIFNTHYLVLIQPIRGE